MRHRLLAIRLRRRSLVLPLLAWLAAGSPAAAQNNPFNSDGFPAARGTYGSFPYEQVDPLSGNLIISVTDLALPGPIPLTVSRSYNSKFHKDFEHNELTIDEWSSVGVGWRLHFGRVLHATEATPGTTVIEGTDGGGGALYQTSDPAVPEGWITKGFLRYDRMSHIARSPNGVTYTFGHIGEASGPRGQVRYVTAIADQFGNSVTFTYAPNSGRVTNAHQFLNASQSRDVNFAYNGNNTLATITYTSPPSGFLGEITRVWTFEYDPAPGAAGHFVLRRVRPPDGLPWEHVYANTGAGPELTALLAPGGGRVDYTYETKQRHSGTLHPYSRVVTRRDVAGRAVEPGTWTFKYNEGTNRDTTVVECPCGKTSYRYNGIGDDGDFSAWKSGTLAVRQVLEGLTVLEEEAFTYVRSEPVSSNTIPGESGQWTDDAVYNALTTQSVLTRGANTWTTTNAYQSGHYNDFGRPYQVTSTGELTRTTNVTFEYGLLPPLLIGGVKTTSITMGGTTIQTGSTVYDPSTGLVTASTSMGVTTAFAYYANGTVFRTTNANNHTTEFSYDWGVLSQTRNPILSAASGINPDGTVGATQVGNDPNPANNQLTTYQYDLVGRLKVVHPRDSNPTSYLYDDWLGNSFVQYTRGPSQAGTALDGFGRAISTANSSGIKTRTGRDACGRVIYASAPFTTGDGSGRGTATTYDGLGRVRTVQTVSVTEPTGTALRTYDYVGPDVKVTEKVDATTDRVTTYDYSSFGGPGDARLMSVLDADGKTTSYQYDIFGNLTQVAGPGSSAPARTWTYSTTGTFLGRLQSDTQPESGPTSYTYDALGNLKTVTDSMQRVTTLTYDSDERLISRTNNADTSANITIAYDLVGRVQQKGISGVVTTYAYDTSSRVTTRTDGIYPSMNFTSRYFYDGNDNLTEIRYPCLGSGCTPRSVTYQYDAESRLTNVLNNNTAFASNFTYDDAGRLATYETGAVTHRFDYDTRDRVSRLRAGPASGNAMDLTYSYNKVSQVMGVADYRPAMSQTFTHDAVDRLTSATSIGSYGTIAWSYDAAGNRLTENRGATTTYNYTSNRLTSTTGANPETFIYNNVGELTHDGQGDYTYSPAGMMLTAARTSTGMAASYLYDADSMRVKHAVNNTTLVTVRGAGGQVLSEMQQRCAGSLEWVRDNIYAGGKLLGAVKSNTLLLPTFQFNTTGTTVSEPNGSVSVGIKMTMNGISLPCAATVSYETAAGTAVPGAAPSGDYTTTAKTVTIPAGTQNNAVINVAIPISNDTTDENDEQFTVRLTGVTGGVLSSVTGATSHTVTIADDDPPPSLTINNVTVNEPAGTANFTVTLSAVSGKNVTVSYATTDVTAVAGSDFTAPPLNASVTIPAGAPSATIPVTILNDLLVELDETFTIALSSPVNATISGGTGVGTIVSDEKKVPIDPSLPGQYFAEVQSSPTEAGYILIFNPHSVAVTAKLTFTRLDGSGLSQQVSIPAQKRVTYDLAGQPVAGWGRFSVAVQSTDPTRPLVSEHSGYGLPSFASGRNDNGATPAPIWYFGEGAANSFFSETLRIFNPTNNPVTVTIAIVRVGQAVLQQTFDITTGPGRLPVHVATSFGVVNDHGSIVSAVVKGTSTPANIVVQRTVEWPFGAEQEMATASGTPTPATNWYFGEGGKGAWSSYIAFMNPSPSQTAAALVFYVHDNGQTYSQDVSIPPMQRVTVSPPTSMPDGGFAIHTGTYNLVPYVVERSMYGGANFALGGSSTPVATPAYTWRFAEGASNGFFDTFFSVFNPSFTTASTVTMTFRKVEDNSVATYSLTVGPRTRVVVSPDSLPSVNGNTYATEVVTTNGVAIVVERAMYWPQGGWNGSHLSMGRPQ